MIFFGRLSVTLLISLLYHYLPYRNSGCINDGHHLLVVLGSNARQYPTHVIKRPRLAETYDISANHSDALQRDEERRGFSMVRRGGCCDGAAVT